MAIGTTPLFSKISGSVGPVDYRTRRNGKIEIGKKRIPANPQSTEQQNTRNAYGRLHELWQNAAWIDKTQYENIAAAYDISPWNAFLMRHLPIMRLNPQAYWPFVEGTGNTIHNFTADENHGTIYGATWQQFGKFDIPQLYFDGIDDYIDFGTGMNGHNSLTLEIWLNPHQLTAGPHTRGISKHSEDMRINNNTIFSVIKSSTTGWGNISYANPTNFKLNSEYHVTTTRNEPAGTAQIHLNGSKVTDDPLNQGPITDNSKNWNIARDHGAPGDPYFKGTVSHASIFDHDISTEQNTHLYSLFKKIYEA